MDKAQINEILKLNKVFYQQIAISFSNTRSYYLKGWGRAVGLVDVLPEKSIKVIDVGCGNGRFYGYLKSQFSEQSIDFTGLDISKELLDIAKRNYPKAKFVKKDVLSETFSMEVKYDLVSCFGVTHHVPDKNLRSSFFQRLRKLTEKNGYVIVTFWNFNQKLAVRDTPYDNLLERNDYFLSWDKTPNLFRYYHYYDEAEKAEIVENFSKNGFELVEDFFADGKDGKSNHYFILKNTATILL